MGRGRKLAIPGRPLGTKTMRPSTNALAPLFCYSWLHGRHAVVCDILVDIRLALVVYSTWDLI
ncbi:hypothetical protein CI102_7404 [Trichoderma harzianum]|nr:hypothetical protein CI102_7404 [Trichoderma harzianum]